MNDTFDTTNDLSEAEPSSLSLMGGVAKPEGLPEAADLDIGVIQNSGKKVSQGTMIILLVVLVAAGSLYAMRIGQGDLSAGGVPTEVMTKIEAALARTSTASTNTVALDRTSMQAAFKDTESIVSMFNTDVTKNQVPLEYVKKNPFALPVQAKVEVKLSADNPGDALRIKEQQRKLQSEFDKFSLQSVMANARIPVVVIDGQFFKTGQTIGSFTIAKIHDRGVELVADGTHFTLSMQDQAGKSNGRRR